MCWRQLCMHVYQQTTLFVMFPSRVFLEHGAIDRLRQTLLVTSHIFAYAQIQDPTDQCATHSSNAGAENKTNCTTTKAGACIGSEPQNLAFICLGIASVSTLNLSADHFQKASVTHYFGYSPNSNLPSPPISQVCLIIHHLLTFHTADLYEVAVCPASFACHVNADLWWVQWA